MAALSDALTAQYFRHEEHPHHLIEHRGVELMRFRISHATSYAYGEPVSLCHSITHLKPRETPHQRCLKSHVRVLPWPAVSREHTDFFGNRVNYFSIQQSHATLEVSAVSEVEVAPPPPNEAASPPWELVRDRLHDGRDADPCRAHLRAAVQRHPAAARGAGLCAGLLHAGPPGARGRA
jgi:transglutaminase-like putative cysteine protease